MLLKSVPSGGARHPTETYVFSIDTELGPGLFHYSVREHGLQRMADLPDEDEMHRLIYELENGPMFPPKAVVVFSSKAERSMWRYREEPRSYRVLCHDVGHVLENMKFAAKATGVRIYFGHGIDDARIGPLLELDGDECVLKFASLA